MYLVLAAWIVYEKTNDAFYTGLLVGSGFLPGLFLNLLFGVLVDRHNRKALALVGQVGALLSVSYTFVCTYLGTVDVVVIILAQMALQTSGSLARPATQAFICEVFKRNHLPVVISRANSAAILGTMLGASFGGLLLEYTTAGFTLFAAMLSIAFSIAALAGLTSVGYQVRQGEPASMFADLVSGLNYVRRSNHLLMLFLIMLTGQLTFHTGITFLSVYTVDVLDSSARIYGLLDASVSIGGVIAGLLGPWWWNTARAWVALHSIALLIAALVTIALSNQLFLAFMGTFFLGLSTTWIRVLLQSAQQMITDANYHGRMACFRMLFNQSAVVVGGPILGYIAARYGVSYAYLALTLPCFAAALISFKTIRPMFMEKFEKVSI